MEFSNCSARQSMDDFVLGGDVGTQHPEDFPKGGPAARLRNFKGFHGWHGKLEVFPVRIPLRRRRQDHQYFIGLEPRRQRLCDERCCPLPVLPNIRGGGGLVV